jgi:hypothetical protein
VVVAQYCITSREGSVDEATGRLDGIVCIIMYIFRGGAFPRSSGAFVEIYDDIWSMERGVRTKGTVYRRVRITMFDT